MVDLNVYRLSLTGNRANDKPTIPGPVCPSTRLETWSIKGSETEAS
jgi:hypothetical protein